jgi:hypothetical protein
LRHGAGLEARCAREALRLRCRARRPTGRPVQVRVRLGEPLRRGRGERCMR